MTNSNERHGRLGVLVLALALFLVPVLSGGKPASAAMIINCDSSNHYDDQRFPAQAVNTKYGRASYWDVFVPDTGSYKFRLASKFHFDVIVVKYHNETRVGRKRSKAFGFTKNDGRTEYRFEWSLRNIHKGLKARYRVWLLPTNDFQNTRHLTRLRHWSRDCQKAIIEPSGECRWGGSFFGARKRCMCRSTNNPQKWLPRKKSRCRGSPR